MIILAILLAQWMGPEAPALVPPLTLPPYQCTGTGCVSRPIASKEGDITSCKDTGCVGDGVADDTTAITNARAAAGAAGFNGVLLPCPGTYKTTTWGALTCGFQFFQTGSGIPRALPSKASDQVAVTDFAWPAISAASALTAGSLSSITAVLAANTALTSGAVSWVGTTNGSPTITWSQFDKFNANWTSKTVKLDGAAYTISSCASATTCTLSINFAGTTNANALALIGMPSAVWISGGVGAAEAMTVTGLGGECPGGVGICGIPANSHSGTYTVASGTAGFQEAINSVWATAVTGTVTAPNGNYTIYAPIVVPAGITVQGEGIDATVLLGGNANLFQSAFRLLGDVATVRDLTINGNQQAKVGVDVLFSTNFIVERIKTTSLAPSAGGSYSFGVNIGNPYTTNNIGGGNYGIVRDSLFYGNYAVDNTGQCGVALVRGSFNVIERNYVEKNNLSIDLEGNNAGDSLTYNIIRRNTIVNSKGAGVQTTGSGDNTGTSVVDNVISGSGTGGGTVGLVAALNLRDAGAGKGGFVVRGNLIYNNNCEGVMFSATRSDFLENIVKNNGKAPTNGCGTHGVLVNTSNSNFIGNTVFDDQGSPTQQYAFAVFATDSGNTFIGNYARKGVTVTVDNNIGATGSNDFIINSGSQTGASAGQNGFDTLRHRIGVAGCATAAAAGAVCTTAVAWDTAFADANYTVTCQGTATTSGVPAIQQAAKVAGTVTVTTVALTAVAAQFTTIDCIALHRPN